MLSNEIMSRLSPEQRLAVNAYQAILREPDTWRQAWWRGPDTRCGARLCFYGHIANETGTWIFPPDSAESYLLYPEENDSYENIITTAMTLRDGNSIRIPAITVESRVERLLGVSGQVSSFLYKPGNTLEDLQSYIMRYLRVNPVTGELLSDRRMRPDCDFHLWEDVCPGCIWDKEYYKEDD
jgi:hypothetical protein